MAITTTHIISAIAYSIAGLLVAYEASIRKHDFWYVFLFSIFSTPLIAAILFSHQNRDDKE